MLFVRNSNFFYHIFFIYDSKLFFSKVYSWSLLYHNILTADRCQVKYTNVVKYKIQIK